jgi:hypothetical protein
MVPGVKVATEPEQATVPATGVIPGPLSVKVVAGDVRVAHFIDSLKFAVSTWPIGTPVAVFPGIVDTTKGGGVIVEKLHT